jgi:hypothetical protein
MQVVHRGALALALSPEGSVGMPSRFPALQSQPMTTTIHLSEPAHLLTVLPYQLGFHPQQCLVTVSLVGPRASRMGLVQRIDLPPPESIAEAVRAMVTPLRQHRPKALLLIGFEEGEGDSRAMLDSMAAACGVRGIRVANRLVVRGGRWFDLDCAQSCCPPEGLPLPAPSSVPAVAEFVWREISPLSARSALADLLQPSRPLRSRAASLLAQEWSEGRRKAKDAGGGDLTKCRAGELALWAGVLCDQDDAAPIAGLLPQDLATLAVSLTDVDLRDALIAWLCPGTLAQDLIDPELAAQMSVALDKPHLKAIEPHVGATEPRGGPAPADADAVAGPDALDVAQVIGRQRIERRLCELSAALPDAWAVSTLTVLASFTWWRGDGALARVALDRALRLDPHYRLAQLLERMVDLAIRPEAATA